MFETVCPSCGKDECLELTSATVYVKGVKIASDGFNIWEARQIDTENEELTCTACGAESELRVKE